MQTLIFQKTLFLTSLNYDTGLKSSTGEKNTIIEALKFEDINNINNNDLISINDRDSLIKFRQFILMQNFETIISQSEKSLKNIRGIFDKHQVDQKIIELR